MINLLIRCLIKFDSLLYKINVPVRIFKNQSFYRRHTIRVKSKVKKKWVTFWICKSATSKSATLR